MIIDPPRRVRTSIACIAYAKREAWMRNRVGAIARPDDPDNDDPGLRLYLSVSTSDGFVELLRCMRPIDDLGAIPRWWKESDVIAS